MEKSAITIVKSYVQELFYSKKFKEEKNAICFGERIEAQGKGVVITLINEKNSNHRWDIDVIEYINGEIFRSVIIVNSKKSAKFVTKKLKEYDDTLKTYITKIY